MFLIKLECLIKYIFMVNLFSELWRIYIWFFKSLYNLFIFPFIFIFNNKEKWLYEEFKEEEIIDIWQNFKDKWYYKDVSNSMRISSYVDMFYVLITSFLLISSISFFIVLFEKRYISLNAELIFCFNMMVYFCFWMFFSSVYIDNSSKNQTNSIWDKSFIFYCLWWLFSALLYWIIVKIGGNEEKFSNLFFF